MTAMPTTRVARSLRRGDVPKVVRLLETDFGRLPAGDGATRHQFLLDALDRGEHSRFALWPERGIGAMIYVGTGGTVVPAGDPEAGPALAAAADASSWRVMIGDAPVARSVVECTGRSVFRRRALAREQRFLVARRVPRVVEPPLGMRLAGLADLPEVTELACLLHVEDQMGPPIPRASRAGVRGRMRDSILRGATWVVERDGRAVAKVDLSIQSRLRGAQIAGVYVDAAYRSQGVAGDCVAAVTRALLDSGYPAVTLHVRADNVPAMRAYERAGFIDEGAWVLALR
jgi:uncharacterized protein